MKVPRHTSNRNVITSKITSKARTTIPQPVRAALRVREGEVLVYTIEKNRVVLTNASRAVQNDPFAAFDEWATKNDRRAYADL
jgi:antitoxin PrlF